MASASSRTGLGKCKGRAYWLDLGDLKNITEIKLNGKDLGIQWKPPFRVDITDALRDGGNELEIRVTNLWPNRLIGDEQLPDDREWDGLHLKTWPQWLLDGKPTPPDASPSPRGITGRRRTLCCPPAS